MEKALSKGKVPKVERHEKCDLGRWIYRALATEGETSALLELERKHKRFHDTADELLELFGHKRYVEAEVLLRELHRESKDLIFLLTSIEYEMFMAGQRTPTPDPTAEIAVP